jgi:hypothetical protein
MNMIHALPQKFLVLQLKCKKCNAPRGDDSGSFHMPDALRSACSQVTGAASF